LRFSQTLNQIFEKCGRAPKRVLAVSFVAFIAILIGLPKLKTELRIYDLRDPKLPSTERLATMKEEFGDKNSVIFIFAQNLREGETPLSKKQICAIRDFLRQEEESNEEIDSVLSVFRLVRPRENRELNKVSYPLLFPIQCTREEMNSTDPAGLEVFQDSPWGRLFTNPKNTDLAAEFRYRDRVETNRFGKFDPRVIGETLARAQHKLETPDIGLKVYLTGRTAPQFHFWKVMQKDQWINALMVFAYVVLLRLFLGTWKSGFLFVGALLIAWLTVLGGMAWAGTPMDTLSSNLLMMLAVAGIEDFLFVHWLQLERFQSGRLSGETIQETYREILVPGFFTSLTTALGFISLLVSDMGMIRRFGFWAGIGSMIEWAIILMILPVFCHCFPKLTWVNPKKAIRLRFLENIGHGSTPRSSLTQKWVLRGALLVFLFGIASFQFLNFEDSMNENFPRGHLQRQTFEYTSQTRGWEGIVNIVFPYGSSQDLRLKVTQAVREHPRVAFVSSPEEWGNYYSQNLQPTTAQAVIRDMNAVGVFRGMHSTTETFRIAIFLKDFKYSSIDQIIKLTRGFCPQDQCYAVGEAVVFAELTERMVKNLVESFLVSIILVGFILWRLAKHLHPWMRIKMIYSALWGPVAVVVFIVLMQVPVNQITSLFLAVLVGLTGDNAIQYLFADKERSLSRGVSARAAASIHVGMILSLSSLCFLFLTLRPMRWVGVLFFLGFILTLIGDLWLLKGLIKPEVDDHPANAKFLV